MASEMVARAAPAADLPSLAKHRACDECRFRKIACSKELHGCSRCRKEGIQCVYSLQKPMGRPRKRRHAETSPPDADVVHAVETPSSTANSAGVTAQPVLWDSLDQSGGLPALSYLDLLPDFRLDNPDIFGYENAAPGQVSFNDLAFPVMPPSGTGILGSIKHGEPDAPAAATVSRDMGDALQRYMASQFAPPSAPSEPSPSTQSSGFELLDTPPTVPVGPRMHKPVPTAKCGCFSSLYLALEALARLPPDVPSAMRVTRNVTKISHDVINCPHCYDFDDVSKPAPIQRFQNLMSLATLVPSACNAYTSILEMVDAETDRAKEEGRALWLSFREVGGPWSSICDDDRNASCAVIRNHNNKHLPPDVWRTTIRAILRVDVYGFDEARTCLPPASNAATSPFETYQHHGLRGVLRLLDEKNHKRHELIDALIESGRMPAHSPELFFPGGRIQCPPEERNCVRVLEAARVALSNLVIPDRMA